MTNNPASAMAIFAALSVGSKFWFRDSATGLNLGQKPVEALKITDRIALIVNGEAGWYLPRREIKSDVDLTGVKANGSGFFGWYLDNNSGLSVWTNDPTVKKTRAKRVATSLIGRRFSLMSLPEGMEGVLTVGMKGTMLQTGVETPSVVFDHHPTIRYIHTSHMGIHRKRKKITLDRLPKQTAEVLSLLKAKGSLTAIEAGGVIRARSLSKRISELKEAGVEIEAETKFDHTGQRYARYHLIPQAA
ncbi:helix-turn-helix domain-containing protein [Neorhizobium sp. S3-V5DH]|uniref:helix-turn-helix domain-containing protein n=1 Tax=Neorhizobium sp. S3-V5DH TaxID=2485166 RepID=UPI0010521468|nr:helix-turn-helix domain-containing protein [Neorhizobium sp. S3-V5DH]TCV62286.1 helix-turn-helix protein [Neorhizobium sp. S3-V5DH]